jgi:hypothetical protein
MRPLAAIAPRRFAIGANRCPVEAFELNQALDWTTLRSTADFSDLTLPRHAVPAAKK